MAPSPSNGSHHHHQAALMNGTNGAGAQQQSAAPRAVHFQVPPVVLSSPSTKDPLVVGKSSLRRSKSFSHDEPAPANASFPAEYQGLVKKALHDPNTLSSHQLMELVRAVCQRATEGIQNAEPSAQLCLSIIASVQGTEAQDEDCSDDTGDDVTVAPEDRDESASATDALDYLRKLRIFVEKSGRATEAKERGETFLESLLSACREWFNERDQLLRPLDATMAVPRRWTAYVCFLAELLLGLRGRTSGGRGTASRTLCLVMLLCDCCHIILRPPSLGNPAEASQSFCLVTLLHDLVSSSSSTENKHTVVEGAVPVFCASLCVLSSFPAVNNIMSEVNDAIVHEQLYSWVHSIS
ncbi:hypothetical protein HPB50_007368 [Hyalomma asiaticum]|uniref:Uncharacterized protein n=1 Tax=Hyalomma asiaticum TaxID=266040 RepID=A0ACB7T6G1_HYAAI|nr:hypothetical protein HPB50_007368 [Hyalomma asiaticum]